VALGITPLVGRLAVFVDHQHTARELVVAHHGRKVHHMPAQRHRLAPGGGQAGALGHQQRAVTCSAHTLVAPSAASQTLSWSTSCARLAGMTGSNSASSCSARLSAGRRQTPLPAT
jgi:hypothetical protein